MKRLNISYLLIVTLLVLICSNEISTLTVDNQLVSVRSDCFERIAFGAMLPLEKAFRMEDMNLLSRCQELCLKEGEKCQTIAFGIHANRNGTCQLSSEKISPTKAQPVGTIFDPDFDLYSRKTNCFDLPTTNQMMPSNNGATTLFDDSSQTNKISPPPYGTVGTTYGTQNNEISSSYPSTPATTSPMDDRYSPKPSYFPVDTRYPSTAPGNQYTNDGYSINEVERNRQTTKRPTSVSDQSSEGYGNHNKMYFLHDGSLYTNQMMFETNYPTPTDSGGSYPGVYAGNAPTVDDRYRPPDMMYARQPRPTSQTNSGTGYGNGFSYGTPDPNRFSNMRPTYDRDRDRPTTNNGAGTTYPGSIYSSTSSKPDNDRNGYTANNRPIDKDYASRPDAEYDNKRRPEDNGYGSRPTVNNRPIDKDYASRPDAEYDNKRRPEDNGYGSRPATHDYRGQRPQETTGTGYGQTMPQDIPSTMPTRPPNGRPQDNKHPYLPGSDYLSGTTKPDDQRYTGDSKKPQGPTSSDNEVGYARPEYGGNGYKQDKPQQKPTNYPGGPDYGSYNKKPEGNYNTTNNGKRIETYFNPDEFVQSKWTTKPTTHYDGNYGDTAGPNEHDRDRYPAGMTACFRRVLAGKRIASQWVRRTIACERVEDCMRECGLENRFQCQGFNYRLDPSGHGQGDCELIDIPLMEIDYYSNGYSRESNLLRHPDYDYYERDRNAPSSCHQLCRDCGGNGSSKPINGPPLDYRPSGYEKPYYLGEHYPNEPSGSGYGGEPDRYRPSNTGINKYRPQPPPDYDIRPDRYHNYDFSSHAHHEIGNYRPGGGSLSTTGYGGDRIDRYDVIRPEDSFRPPPNSWQSIPSSHAQIPYRDDFHLRPHGYIESNNHQSDYLRPAYRPGIEYSPYKPLQHISDRYGSTQPPSSHSYLERDRSIYNKPSPFIPYLIGFERDSVQQNRNSNYWGVQNENRRMDNHIFNYFELGENRRHSNGPIDNYIGSRYGGEKPGYNGYGDRHDFSNQWTRRPGPDECSVKSSEGFRLNKNAISHAYTVPTITECEKLCFAENKFNCHTYSYRYSMADRNNCLLCDRPVNLLDYYADMEPDRNYDIYSMSDEHNSCRQPAPLVSSANGVNGGRDSSSTAISDPRNDAHCFFRAIDATRFSSRIVRDSLMVRSIGECELECIKSSKFTCRAFAFRYGQRTQAGVIDNCQLSDWPVRDMDKERHLASDPSFDIFERASYGHGCEIQPIVDDKHKKLCYLGYGAAAKLLPAAIKKVISVPTEIECKKECIQFRDNTSFKCQSFSFGSQRTTFNCEMSDLDQSQLKLDIHYTHVKGRDYWLFAWNPFDWTCRDKVTTIGGNRVNNDRRMDIFREPGDVTWRHYTVSGRPCRIGSGCDKNIVTGFYSCEIDSGEVGSWDYCCKADYPCGYSKGFEYPWCFVGDEPAQWRKCSDRYFPGNNTQNTNDNNTASTTDQHKKKPGLFQRPPKPGGLQSLIDFTAARLWPVTYLYSEIPPNSTDLTNFVDCNKEIC